MKKVSKEILKLTANKLMFDMSDDEYSDLVIEFENLIKHMELIGEIEGVDDAEPMNFPFDVTSSTLREDVPSIENKQDELFKNSQDVVDGQIRLPKVVK